MFECFLSAVKRDLKLIGTLPWDNLPLSKSHLRSSSYHNCQDSELIDSACLDFFFYIFAPQVTDRFMDSTISYVGSSGGAEAFVVKAVISMPFLTPNKPWESGIPGICLLEHYSACTILPLTYPSKTSVQLKLFIHWEPLSYLLLSVSVESLQKSVCSKICVSKNDLPVVLCMVCLLVNCLSVDICMAVMCKSTTHFISTWLLYNNPSYD